MTPKFYGDSFESVLQAERKPVELAFVLCKCLEQMGHEVRIPVPETLTENGEMFWRSITKRLVRTIEYNHETGESVIVYRMKLSAGMKKETK